MLSIHKLVHFVNWADGVLGGAQLQSIRFHENAIHFSFYKFKMYHLYFRFEKGQSGLFLLDEDLKLPTTKKNNPVVLYMNAHIKNQRIQKIGFPIAGERIIEIEFERGKIEFYLIPGLINCKVSANSKDLWLAKPILKETSPNPQATKDEEIFTFNFESEKIRWNQKIQGLSNPAQTGRDYQLKQDRMIEKIKADLEKKTKKLVTLKEFLKKDPTIWNSNDLETLGFGELQTKPWFEINQELQTQVKKLKVKIQSSLERLEAIQSSSPKDVRAVLKSRDQAVSMLKKHQVAARMFEVGSFLIVYGKSGTDNLKLLRAAQPWDIWFHIYPGAGAFYILRRNKGQKVSEEVIQNVCQQILKLSQIMAAQIVVTEVKFVTPIKGAKPGLVKFVNERLIQVNALRA